MGIFELTTGGAIGMLGAGLAVCLAGAGSARGTGLAGARWHWRITHGPT